MVCGGDMAKSPSDWFCKAFCQEFWAASQSDPLVVKPQVPLNNPGYSAYAAAYGMWGLARSQAQAAEEAA